MKNEVIKYLFDIKIAIELIHSFSSEIATFEQYEEDYKTQSAVERKLVIIGEAINKIQKVNSGISFENDHQIVAFRNRLVHAYDSIDNSIVWLILKKHLGNLEKEVNSNIEELNAESL